MRLSNPAILTSLGFNDEFFTALTLNKRGFSKREFLGHEFEVGAINFNLADFSNKTPKNMQTRTNQILLSLCLKLDTLVQKAIKKYGKDKIGVVIGTTTTGVEENLKAFLGQNFDINKFDLDRNSLSNPALFVREFYGLSSLAFGVSTACTSGIKAIASGVNLIELGLCDAVICGGVDSLNSLTVLGFNSLGVLSNGYCKPFCEDRDGINIGEGGCLFLLSKDEGEFELKSILSNCDAYHITQPNPEATKQTELINSLLNEANLNSVDYANLHGTGTLANDKMEAKAVLDSLGDVLCSSIKVNIGHTLGAAGAIECGFCMLASKNSLIPKALFGKIDSEFNELNLAKENTKIKIKNVLNLSFAFGGDNAGLIVGV